MVPLKGIPFMPHVGPGESVVEGCGSLGQVIEAA